MAAGELKPCAVQVVAALRVQSRLHDTKKTERLFNPWYRPRGHTETHCWQRQVTVVNAQHRPLGVVVTPLELPMLQSANACRVPVPQAIMVDDE